MDIFEIGKRGLFFFLFISFAGVLSAENKIQFPNGTSENDKGKHWISINGFKLFVMENEKIPSGHWKIITDRPTNIRVEVKSPYKLKIEGREIGNEEVKLSIRVKKEEEYYSPNKLTVEKLESGEVSSQTNKSEVILKDGENVKIIVDGIHNSNGFNMPEFRRETKYTVFATTSVKGEPPVYENDFSKFHFQIPDIIEKLLHGSRKIDENKINIALVLDTSGSMGGEKIESCKKAGEKLIDELYGYSNQYADTEIEISIALFTYHSYSIGKERSFMEIRKCHEDYINTIDNLNLRSGGYPDYGLFIMNLKRKLATAIL